MQRDNNTMSYPYHVYKSKTIKTCDNIRLLEGSIDKSFKKKKTKEVHVYNH